MIYVCPDLCGWQGVEEPPPAAVSQAQRGGGATAAAAAAAGPESRRADANAPRGPRLHLALSSKQSGMLTMLIIMLSTYRQEDTHSHQVGSGLGSESDRVTRGRRVYVSA